MFCQNSKYIYVYLILLSGQMEAHTTDLRLPWNILAEFIQKLPPNILAMKSLGMNNYGKVYM